MDALASDISNSGKLEQALVKNTELVEGWRVLYDANERSLTKNVKSLQNVTKHIEAIKKVGGYDDWKKVQIMIDSWSDAQKKLLDDALQSNLGDKVRRTSGHQLYTRFEEISYEVMDWARKKFFPANKGWMEFATDGNRVVSFRAWKFVAYMKINPKYINISLGSFDRAGGYAKKLKSTGFKDFKNRGFLTTDDWLGYDKVGDWLPYVAKTIKKSYDHGGKIYIHFDGKITGFKGIYDRTDSFYKEGLAAELRYLIDNGLVDKGRVDFFLGADPLPADLQKLLDKAIKQRKKNIAIDPKKYGSQKGNYGYSYN